MYHQNHRDLKVVGIDPGSSHLGLAIVTLDGLDHSVKSIKADTLHAEKLLTYSKDTERRMGGKFARIMAYKDYLLPYLDRLNASVIACESPFHQPGRTQAYGVLVEVVHMLTEICYLIHPEERLLLFSPMEVKRSVGCTSYRKEDIRSYLEHYRPYSVISWDMDNLDEHGVDAVAVTACVYNQIQSRLNRYLYR